MTTETKTLAQILAEQSDGDKGWAAEALASMQRWQARGDSVLVYINEEFGHPEMGQAKYVSYGSENALIERTQYPEPPAILPDVLGQINWRYVLRHRFDPEAQP